MNIGMVTFGTFQMNLVNIPNDFVILFNQLQGKRSWDALHER